MNSRGLNVKHVLNFRIALWEMVNILLLTCYLKFYYSSTNEKRELSSHMIVLKVLNVSMECLVFACLGHSMIKLISGAQPVLMVS